MPINLINDPWLPVRRADGSRDRVRPADIVGAADSPTTPVSLDAARPDYDGAAIQILVGLIQTFLPPADEDAWWAWFEEPPAVDELHGLLAPLAEFFELTGVPAFMQDVEELPEKFESQIDSLHLTAPGNNTLNHNKDLFLKRQDSFAMCPTCATLALAASQFNATAGGPGFRTSIRGGGPVTTILRGRTLWDDVWLNVLPRHALSGFEPPDPSNLAATLPWLGECRESSKAGVDTPFGEINSHQSFWSNSKRLRVRPAEEADGRACSVCGANDDLLFTRYRELRYGTNYVGPWEHPLTPYTHQDGNDPNPLKGSPDGFGYKHWRGIVANHDGANRKPARSVQHFRSEREEDFALDYPEYPIRVWAFGYDADNAKIRSWHEGTYPIVALPEDGLREKFDWIVGLLVEAADEAASAVKTALKQALYGEVEITSTGKRKWSYDASASTDASLFTQAETEFWRRTEASFYAILPPLGRALRDEDAVEEVKLQWLKVIERRALELFDEVASYGNFRNADPKVGSMARSGLRYAFLRGTEKRKAGWIAKTLQISNQIDNQEETND